MSGVQYADRVAGRHRLPGAHAWPDRLVGRSQPTRMVDADHAAAGQDAGVRHDAGAGRPYRGPRYGPEVHAAVPGQPRLRRCGERAYDHGVAVQRPPVARPWRQPRGTGERDGGLAGCRPTWHPAVDDDHENGQEGERRHT
jgi:hypothetical protein